MSYGVTPAKYVMQNLLKHAAIAGHSLFDSFFHFITKLFHVEISPVILYLKGNAAKFNSYARLSILLEKAK